MFVAIALVVGIALFVLVLVGNDTKPEGFNPPERPNSPRQYFD